MDDGKSTRALVGCESELTSELSIRDGIAEESSSMIELKLVWERSGAGVIELKKSEMVLDGRSSTTEVTEVSRVVSMFVDAEADASDKESELYVIDGSEAASVTSLVGRDPSLTLELSIVSIAEEASKMMVGADGDPVASATSPEGSDPRLAVELSTYTIEDASCITDVASDPTESTKSLVGRT